MTWANTLLAVPQVKCASSVCTSRPWWTLVSKRVKSPSSRRTTSRCGGRFVCVSVGTVTPKCLRTGHLASVAVNSRWNQPPHNWVWGSCDIGEHLCPPTRPLFLLCPSPAALVGFVFWPPPWWPRLPRASFQGGPGTTSPSTASPTGSQLRILGVWLQPLPLSWLLWLEQDPCRGWVSGSTCQLLSFQRFPRFFSRCLCAHQRSLAVLVGKCSRSKIP